MFNSTNDDDIVSGNATDAYFLRTEDALDEIDHNPTVVADVAADQFQSDEYEVLAGVNDVAEMVAESDLNIDAWTLPEGSMFNGGPVMRLRGNYADFARYETSLLGFLSHASGIATNAYEVMRVGNQQDATILSFGARHVNPKIAPVVERGALITGFDGISHVSSGEQLGVDASGTIPHALVISIGTQEDAWNAFNDSAPEETPRIVIADTFTDEADEALRAARELGDDLDGVRLDTTGSRRGDFKHIIKEVRWKLDAKGYDDVGIYVSGGLGPADIEELGGLVEGFGIGGYVSNADPVDFSLDIVRRDGDDVTKRGKLPGVKTAHREDGHHVVEPAEDCDAGMFEKFIDDGEVVKKYSIEDANKNFENDMEILN